MEGLQGTRDRLVHEQVRRRQRHRPPLPQPPSPPPRAQAPPCAGRPQSFTAERERESSRSPTAAFLVCLRTRNGLVQALRNRVVQALRNTVVKTLKLEKGCLRTRNGICLIIKSSHTPTACQFAFWFHWKMHGQGRFLPAKSRQHGRWLINRSQRVCRVAPLPARSPPARCGPCVARPAAPPDPPNTPQPTSPASAASASPETCSPPKHATRAPTKPLHHFWPLFPTPCVMR